MEKAQYDTPWFVAHTQPRKEAVAGEHLCNQGFAVFLPSIHVVKTHARKKVVSRVPLFPRYLFIQSKIEAPKWSAVDSTRGVSYLLRQSNHEPTPVPPGIVEALMDSMVEGEVPLSSLLLFQPGQKLRLMNGAFQGNVAIYEKMTDEDRVQILLDMLGRQVRMRVSVHDVVAL